MRTTRSALGVALTVTLLSACTADGDADPRPAATGAGSSDAASLPTRGSTATDAGSAANPRAILCVGDEPYGSQKWNPAPDDVVVGPFSWPTLRTWATADPRDKGEGDRYKLGVKLKAGSVVTVTVGPEARAVAGLTYGQRWSYTPAESVTFHACAETDTSFIGGFEVHGHRCVPFDITVGDEPPTRVVVSFFTGGPCE